MQFIIKGKMPSLNEVIDVSRRNKFAGNRLKQDIQQDIELQIYQQIRENDLQKLLPLPYMADFRFTYYEKNQKRDKDNIASCKKFLFDALVKRGVINNDGWKWVGRFEEDFLLGEDYMVVIDIEKSKGEEKCQKTMK